MVHGLAVQISGNSYLRVKVVIQVDKNNAGRRTLDGVEAIVEDPVGE